MKAMLRRRGWRLVIVLGVMLALAGGIAYATIPGDGGIYNACMLKATGTLRLIDPSLPSTNLMSHCTSLETAISWNQKGQQGLTGLTGPQGPKGDTGADRTSGSQG
jgi:hypothetical protein